MKKNNKILIIICITLIVVSVSCYFGIKYYLKKDLERYNNELNKMYEKYGYVEKENVYTLIAKFNTEIMDNGLEYPASDDYLTIQDNTYWYGLYDDIYCYVVVDEYTGDKEKDNVSIMTIYYPKKSSNEALASNYVRKLIKANNYDLNDSEIDELISKAKSLSEKGENAQSGKGIALALVETDDYYNYEVIRIHK